MDDFEYSVEISDRDWQCFFTECEECNLLPPSLAGVDDSGMSDLDDTASMFARRAQKHDLTAGLSEAGGPPCSRSPPVGHYLGKQGGSGMESVLSGSEEDIHLQCVNMFFERLRNLPEAERPDGPSQERPGKNREAALQRGDGRRASGSTLPETEKNVKEVDIVSDKNATKEVKPGAGVSLEPAASNSAMNANGLAHPETEETKVKPECRDSPTPETAPYTDAAIQGHMFTLDGVKQQHFDLLSSRKNPDVPQPDATGQSKTATQQPSPSASVKRKRRKKRRLSIEPVESGLGYERPLLGGQRPDDSEEERRPWRGAAGVCLPESSSYPLTSSPPARTSAEEVGVNYGSDPVELSGLDKYCWVPCSVATSVSGKSDGGTGNCEGNDTERLQQRNEVNHVDVDCESRSTEEVKAITRSILPRAHSNIPAVDVSQNDNLSVAKSVLAVEGGSSGRYEHTLCRRGAEQQQQLEADADQYSSTPGKTGVCEAGGTGRDAHHVNAGASPFPDDTSCKEAGAKLAEGCTSPSPGQSRPSVNQTPSDLSPPSPRCTLDTLTSHWNENVADVSARFCASVSQSESEGERQSAMLEMDATGPKSQTVSESKGDVAVGAGDKPKTAPDSRPSVFSMSSFWSEMEKLTINDILGLRMADKAAPHGALSPLQEHEETDTFATSVFTQLDDSVPDSEPSGLASALALESPSPRGVTWESEAVPVSPAADVYPQNMTLTSAISPAVFPGGVETCLRKISKNTSVHNLHALESEPFSSALKHPTLTNLGKGGSEKVQYVPEELGPSPSSLMGGYRTSIGDMFRYFFGGKEPVPSPSSTDNVTTSYADGSTLPETYDHFFCDFDTESFFCPLIPGADAKEELVPIFSYSRSANRNLQFPEAYDYFFPSSSSDDSSVESDDDENPGPVRAVSRFTRKSSSSPKSVDAYEHFFTDRDLGQNFFWKYTFSFRNLNLTGFRSQKPPLSNALVPARQGTTSPPRTVWPSNVVGNQDVLFPDPLLHHLEDRISKQLRQEPFRYDDLQAAVSNPRMDASFLPLRQSDMCLVCIAFASWVLKTANPQAGDAWKAVVLANVSALSAIRYLRKYVKLEAAANEKKLQTDISSES